MSLTADISAEVDEIFKTQWTARDGDKVPEPEDIQLGNHAVRLDGTVLYADLADSTIMVNSKPDWYAAEVYKSYLISACQIIRENGGEITAFDGDRVMAVYLGDYKNTSAAKTALQINYVVSQIINPKLKARYPEHSYQIRQVVGIDTSKLYVARTGIRGSNDLVWVGRAANVAAKMCGLRHGGNFVYITKEVLDKLNDSVKYSSGTPKQWMWESFPWDGQTIYRSSWVWSAD
jgi:class 3 adenylate cyclase